MPEISGFFALFPLPAKPHLHCVDSSRYRMEKKRCFPTASWYDIHRKHHRCLDTDTAAFLQTHRTEVKMEQNLGHDRLHADWFAAADFLCERRLKALSPQLHTRYRSSVFAMERLLANYLTVFPNYTNHTFSHSAQVINYCNILIGAENIGSFNADELYILLMGAALHDVGMGISSADFAEMRGSIPGGLDIDAGKSDRDIIRDRHQEFSAAFIRKYGALFEIPSEAHLHCICQLARGHRRMDLLDETAFPPSFSMPEGTVIRLPYLAALVKLADEMDVTADRNFMFDYAHLDEHQTPEQLMCYKTHKALLRLEEDSGVLVLRYNTDDPAVAAELQRMSAKAQTVFREFSAVAAKTPGVLPVHSGIEYRPVQG